MATTFLYRYHNTGQTCGDGPPTTSPMRIPRINRWHAWRARRRTLSNLKPERCRPVGWLRLSISRAGPQSAVSLELFNLLLT